MSQIIRIVNNRAFQLILSFVALFYFYSNTNISGIVGKISSIPFWFTLFMLVYTNTVSILASVRWGIILWGKPTFRQIWLMYKSAQVGSFFSMFLPTPLAGDGMKWLKVANNFPEVPKSHLLASVLVDRVVGISTLGVTGFFSVILSRFLGYMVPDFMFWIGLGMFLSVVFFYFVLVVFDFDKLEGKNSLLDKFINVDRAFRQERGASVILALFVSVFAQFVWMLPIFFSANMFGIELRILDIFIYVPLMSLILALPISFAGFGPREALYVFFFGQLGHSPELLLALSAYMGVLGLLGGLVSSIFVFL